MTRTNDFIGMLGGVFSGLFSSEKEQEDAVTRYAETPDEYPAMTSVEAEIMRVLVGAGAIAMHGLEVVQRSEGKLSKGAIHAQLDRMEQKGFLTCEKQARSGRGRPRLLYKPTGLGQRVWHARQAWTAAHVAAFGGA